MYVLGSRGAHWPQARAGCLLNAKMEPQALEPNLPPRSTSDSIYLTHYKLLKNKKNPKAPQTPNTKWVKT